MSTHKNTWKRREREAADLFGAKRQRCSGSSGRDDCSRSDSTHDLLFIETKLRERHAAVALLDATRALAKKEGRVPVLALASKGRPGVALVIDSGDLPRLLVEFAAALDDEGRDRLEGAIRRAVLRRRGEGLPADFGPASDWPPQLVRSLEPEDISA